LDSHIRLRENSEIFGGVIVEINDDNINHLDLLFLRDGFQIKGMGQVMREIV